MSSLRTDVPAQTGVPGTQPINSATRASGKKRPTRAPKPVDHTGSARVSLLLFLALGLALSSLNSLLGGVTWLITTVCIAALVLGAAAGTRVLLRNRWAPTVIGVLVTVGALSLLYAPTTAIAGVIPTGETWAAFRSLSGEATASIAEQGIPADPVQGILFLLSWATAIIAVLLDLIANWWRAPALVGVPLLFVLSVPSLIDGTLADPWLFALTAIVYLLLLRPHTRRIQGTLALGIGATAVIAALVLPLVLPAVTPNTGGGGARDAVATGINPILNLGDDLRRGTPTTALTYTSTAPQGEYLRLTTLDSFEGDEWEPAPIRPLRGNSVDAFGPPPGLTDDVPATPIVSDVTINNVIGRWLPVPYPATSVRGLTGEWFWEPDGLAVRSVESNMRGQEYSVSSLELDPTAEQLAAAPDSSGLALAEVPAGLDPIVAQTALDVTSAATTDYDRALALQSYFRSGEFTYSEEAPVEDGFDGSGLDVLAPFLEAKTGYCVHYSSAMAVMARTLGIPSRVVVGFLPGDPRTDLEGITEFTVSSNDLHAWPELYFEGTGWIRFEPTPGRGIAAAFSSAPIDNPSTPDVDESQPTATPAPAPTTAPSTAPQQDPTGALDTPETAASKQGWLVSFIVLAVLLLLASPALVRMGIRARRFAAIDKNETPAAEGWAEIADTARDLGLVGTITGTPRELTARLSPGLRDTELDALHLMRISVEREVFAEKTSARASSAAGTSAAAEPSPSASGSSVVVVDDAQPAIGPHAVSTVLRGLRRGRGAGTRARATLLPKSLLDRILAVRVKFGA
jgi:transglutaminase-like putative cysteine protease